MARPKARMTARKLRAADMLGAGEDYQEVARIIGVDQSTVWRWQQEDVFCDAVELASKRFLARTVPKARRKLADQMGAENDWLAQNAANSILRERGQVEGAVAQQVVVTFAMDDTEPGMPPVAGEDLVEDGPDGV